MFLVDEGIVTRRYVMGIMDEMNEDAGCNKPCGMEPMGCATCAERGGNSAPMEREADLEAGGDDQPDFDCLGDCEDCAHKDECEDADPENNTREDFGLSGAHWE
jgi:hypothetical protein